MLAERARLPGASNVKPLRQGDLSNLCGLYSVLNAVQLACWRVPPTDEQLRELLAFGMRYLIRRRLLAHVIACGMDRGVWVELCAAVIHHSNDVLSASLALKPLVCAPSGPRRRDPVTVINSLKRTLLDGCPVLCGFGGGLDHFTVLSGYSSRRLTLFDSSGFYWLDQRSIGASEQCGKRHWLYVDSARAVVDEW